MIHSNTSRKYRASDFPPILEASDGGSINKAINHLVQIYVLSLMISGYPRTLKNIASYFGHSIAAFSRLLQREGLDKSLDLALNRNVRRLLAKHFTRQHPATIDIIIDATLIERSGRKVENAGLYHANGKKQWGHRITNIGLLLDGELYIPLAVLPHKTRAYANKTETPYLTEGQMVRRWLRLYMGNLLATLGKFSVSPSEVTFLLDAGYDTRKIQKAICDLGCHFVMMIKKTRSVGKCKVNKFFTRHRNIKWASVFIKKMVNSKVKRRKFRLREASNVMLAGVGFINAICSEKSCGSSKNKTRRYLATSNLNLHGRDILIAYSRRWAIETWHKKIKQDYGIGDCSCHSFIAVYNHILMTIIAFQLHQMELKSTPQKTATIADFIRFKAHSEAKSAHSKFGGKKALDEQIDLDYQAIYGFAG